MMTFRLSCLALYLLASVSAPAQTATVDTSFVALAKTKQVKRYEQLIRGQSRLYNGSEYRDYFSKNDEHPYFGIDDWSYGDLLYDDELYSQVPMFYDISRDRVITEHLLNGAKIELASEKIKRFSLEHNQFVRLLGDDAKVIQRGFYELLYDGETKVFARREKMLMQKVESNDIVARFDIHNRLFIRKVGSYYPVKSKGSVLSVFADKKQEIKSFLKKGKISYNTDREKSIVRMAEYYDRLTQ